MAHLKARQSHFRNYWKSQGSLRVSAAATANLANEFLTRVSSDLKGRLTIAARVDSTVSVPPLLLETMWNCTSFLGREVTRHPPAPGRCMVGGSRPT